MRARRPHHTGASCTGRTGTTHPREIWRSPGRAGHAIVLAKIAPAARHTPRTMALPGNPRGESSRCTSPGNQAGRRRIIDSIAAVSVSHRATESMMRRWAARGGPEGRSSGNGIAHPLPSRRVPRTIGHAIQAGARLKVGPAPRRRSMLARDEGGVHPTFRGVRALFGASRESRILKVGPAPPYAAGGGPEDRGSGKPQALKNSNTYRTAVTMMTRQSITLMARAGTNFCARAPQYIPAAPPRPKRRPNAQSGPTPIHE